MFSMVWFKYDCIHTRVFGGGNTSAV